MVTGAIYKGFVFDGIDSKQYGVYITGQGVFDAPVRDVEMIEIPGRNGSYALDKGRFKNIEVTYPAGMFGNTDGDFMQGISDLRNALASRKGYCRLTDEYNPNEYRMAVYKSGLEVSPAQLKAGQFDITFDCKPQRFLTSGETEQTVTSGATITNPTLFDSEPLLRVLGYGKIKINSSDIVVENEDIGNVTLQNESDLNYDTKFILDSNTVSLLNTSDTITIPSGLRIAGGIISRNYPTIKLTGLEIAQTGTIQCHSQIISKPAPPGGNGGQFYIITDEPIHFSYGTTDTSKVIQATITVPYTNNGVASSFTTTMSIGIHYYSGAEEYIEIVKGTNPLSPLPPSGVEFATWGNKNHIGTVTAYSTKNALSEGIYIDLDIGECYMIKNGEIISLNTYVNLGADLPTLKPGANIITYDNTIDELKITPRWWKV